jgi:hypothetical protein
MSLREGPGDDQMPTDKSFLLLFLEKEVLPRKPN